MPFFIEHTFDINLLLFQNIRSVEAKGLPCKFEISTIFPLCCHQFANYVFPLFFILLPKKIILIPIFKYLPNRDYNSPEMFFLWNSVLINVIENRLYISERFRLIFLHQETNFSKNAVGDVLVFCCWHIAKFFERKYNFQGRLGGRSLLKGI